MGRKGKGRGKGARRVGKGKGKGRRVGGKGKGRRLAGPGNFSHAAVHFGAPAPLPEDPAAPFLHPTARSLVKVPLEFSSLRQWCDVIGNNILAEFWQVYREGRGVFTGFGGAAGDELIIDNAPVDGFTQHLLLVDRQPRIVTSQRVLGVGKVAVKLRGGGARSGQVKSLGYIGSFLAEYGATVELRKLPPRELTGPMRAILEPKVDLPGDYARRKLNVAEVPVNPSQRSAVEGLRFAVEKIQGPPGTGKSTTIFHIIDSRVPLGERILVTCSRNVAVESIAQKLEGLEDWPLCVFGPRDRVGDTARRYLLDSQVGGHFDERRLGKVSPLIAKSAEDLQAAINKCEAFCHKRKGERFLLAFLRKRHAGVYALREFCERLGAYCHVATSAPEWCKKRTLASKEQVLVKSRIILCTIASTSRLIREWEESSETELRVHTVIVDECGCTPESSTALLFRLRPSNLILVGDHKQLPPTSMMQPQMLEGSGHTRSLLERCVLASGQVHQLKEQYRMHPGIASLVSRLFYAGRLVTPQSVQESRKRREDRPLVWLDVQGREEAPDRSYMNNAEITASVNACAKLRDQVPHGASIAVLTFYRGQLDALMHAMPSSLGVDVLTVDACQGSEFDYVVLSTVRANREQRIGFAKDPQRINVAISRARLKLVIVGHRYTMTGDGDWRQVAEACSSAMPQEFAPSSKLPSTFVSVFDMLRAEKDREAQQKATAAMEEAADRKGVSAEALMQRQMSLRNKGGRYESRSYNSGPVRQNDGTYKSNNIAAVIGGGFRRRADIYAIDAQVSHHQATLEAATQQSLAQTAGMRYHAPRSNAELEENYPELGNMGDSASSSKPQKAPRAVTSAKSGALRPSTRNDEKRRRAAQRMAASQDLFQEERTSTAPLVLPELAEESEWEDVEEAMLFEMFPEDCSAVEECLLRFAGVKHQGARALEALLARPLTQGKTLDDGDDLDYDIAPQEDFDDEDDEEGFWEDGEDYDEAEEWDIMLGCCAVCGYEGVEERLDDDGLQYCSACWAEWTALASGSSECVIEEHTSRGQRPEPPPVPKQQRPEPPPVPKESSQAEASKKATPKPKGHGGRQTERVAFFDGLDGVPKWSEAPARPEAGGKELVALQSKEDRDKELTGPQRGRRWNKGSGAVPSAALKVSAKESTESRSDRCRSLLAAVEPQIEEGVVEYLSSLVEDDVGDDTREAVLEILDGHGVAKAAAETFWQGLVAC